MRMPDVLMPPALAVVVLGLLASLGWGVADFGGGLASRSAPVLGVLMWSQVASFTIGVPILLLSPEPPMRDVDVAVSIGGGLLAAVGLAFLYRGLSVGRMGVVAPIAAVLTATLPVAFGFLTEGIPSILAIVGIALAALSVVLVSRAASEPASEGAAGTDPVRTARSTGIWYAVAAGCLFGTFSISASFLPDELIFSPVMLIRVASIASIAAWLLVRRGPWRVPRRLWPALVAIGVVDMLATASYLSSIGVGPLAIAAILASLYPIVTTFLATVVLRERMTFTHVAGIAAAGFAVALIAGASA